MLTRTRAALAAALALVLCVLVAAPASATVTGPTSVIDQHPSVMTVGQALLVFAGIPLLVVALVWLLVSAPGWTRDGRPSDADAWTGDAVVVGGSTPEMRAGSQPAALDAAGTEEAAAEDAAETGGTSAQW